MLGWVFVICVIATVSFIMHIVGWMTGFTYDIRVQVIWDILLLLVALGLLSRIVILHKEGEKEALSKKVKELEEKLKAQETQ